jgi:hypothetical protein
MTALKTLTLLVALGAGATQADTTSHGNGHGHGHAATITEMTGDHATDIAAMMKAQFETPDHPLTVAPITVQGDVAIAGWMQDGRGGRAFLRRDNAGWFIELCAGTGLLLTETLTGLGLTSSEAGSLLAANGAAEAEQGAEVIALLDSFDGMLVIGRNE